MEYEVGIERGTEKTDARLISCAGPWFENPTIGVWEGAVCWWGRALFWCSIIQLHRKFLVKSYSHPPPSQSLHHYLIFMTLYRMIAFSEHMAKLPACLSLLSRNFISSRCTSRLLSPNIWRTASKAWDLYRPFHLKTLSLLIIVFAYGPSSK